MLMTGVPVMYALLWMCRTIFIILEMGRTKQKFFCFKSALRDNRAGLPGLFDRACRTYDRAAFAR